MTHLGLYFLIDIRGLLRGFVILLLLVASWVMTSERSYAQDEPAFTYTVSATPDMDALLSNAFFNLKLTRQVEVLDEYIAAFTSETPVQSKLSIVSNKLSSYSNIGDYDAAGEYAREAQANETFLSIYNTEEFKTENLLKEVDTLINNIGFTYHRLGQPEKALEYLTLGMEVIEKADATDSRTIFSRYLMEANIGRAYLLQGNFEDLAPIAQRTYDGGKELDVKYFEVIGLRLLGNVEHSKGNYKKAAAYLKEGIEISEEAQMGEILGLFYNDYAASLEAARRYKDAYQALSKYDALRAANQEGQISARLGFYKAKADQDLRQQEIQTLIAEKDAASLIRSRERGILVLTIISLIVMALLLISQFKARRWLQTYSDDLRTSERKAKQANEAKSAFLANMSHEIRTPMNGVLGMAELLQSTDLDVRQKSFTDTIYKSGSALLTIINDILDFSKIEAGKLQLDPAPFNLRDAIEDVATLLATRAREKNIELILRYAPHLPLGMTGDVGRIRQIITNLVGNAIKFTHQGHVLINVTGIITDDMADLVIEIEDTGIGINEDKLEQIFEEFSQAESSTTRQFGGTGLGLTISRKLADAMGGKLTAKSSLGKGSLFTATLKLPIAEIAQSVPSIVPDLSSLKVLIVDDLEVNRTIQLEQLALWNLNPHAVDGGTAALSALSEAHEKGAPFDLVLLDYHMPEMDGAQVAKAIRENDQFGSIGIIVLSSTDAAEEVATFRQLGVKNYLTKPAKSSLLLDTIAIVAAGSTDAPNVSIAQPAATETSSEQHLLAKVLVAEDNEVNRLVVKSFLEPLGLELTFAVNGKEAFEFAKLDDYDMILMDVSMPEMDGMESTQAIRSHEISNNLVRTPIICLTAHVMAEDRQKSLDAGMDDYLSKPIKKTKLEATIAKWRNVKDEWRAEGASQTQPNKTA